MAEKDSKTERFTEAMLKQSQVDSGLRAALRMADNPRTESRAWPILIRWGVDITKPEKEAFCLIASAAGRFSAGTDGKMSLGQVLRRCFEGDSDSPAAVSRLQRLLSCDTLSEACAVMRPMLRFIQSRQPDQLCLSKLLTDLLFFNSDRGRSRTKEQWAMDFYRPDGESQAQEAA